MVGMGDGREQYLWVARSASECITNETVESRLAYTTTDGAVGTIVIRRSTEILSSAQMGFDCQVGEDSVVDIGDKRNVACLQWIDVGILGFHL
jgi:hypothetical protein